MKSVQKKLTAVIATSFAVIAYVVMSVGCGYKSMVSGYETKVNFTGQVVEAASDEPMKDVTVNVTPPNSDKPLTAVTDNLGYFEIKNMKVGKVGGLAGGGNSGGLATVTIDRDGYKAFAKKYPIESPAAIGSAMTTTNIGTIKLERSGDTSAK